MRFSPCGGNGDGAAAPAAKTAATAKGPAAKAAVAAGPETAIAQEPAQHADGAAGPAAPIAKGPAAKAKAAVAAGPEAAIAPQLVAVAKAKRPPPSPPPSPRWPPPRQVFALDFFRANNGIFSQITGSYRQHSAALKYFRDQTEDPDDPFNSPHRVFDNLAPAEVATVIWGKGPNWSFDRNRMVKWSWTEMIAQLDVPSMDIVVTGGGGR